VAELPAPSACFRVDNVAEIVDRPSVGGDNLGTYVLFCLHSGQTPFRLDGAARDGLTAAL
jgi:hypothetical protein